jgi:hypothetical protein
LIGTPNVIIMLSFYEIWSGGGATYITHIPGYGRVVVPLETVHLSLTTARET